ncbi:MAG TPA: glycosyltransferase family 4 protein [Terracidiphilus sp.]|nr:glycosyltransferase family 4 protein [Terracidiphilus sp.]
MNPQTESCAGALPQAAEAENIPSSRSSHPELSRQRLRGKRAGMVVFSPYPSDPRPRRAADALLQEGMTLDLLCEGVEGSPRRERLGNLDVTRIPIRHHRGGGLSYAYQYSLFIFLSGATFAWRALRRRYDLIYVHNMPDILVVSAWFPKLLGAKVILDQHDPMPELMRTIFGKEENSFSVRVLRYLEKWSFRRADLVVTVNEACRKIFSARSCAAEKVAVVMNTPDEGIFPFRAARSYPSRKAGEPFVIMYHGSLVERNGVELAVDALALAVEKVPAAELRIYGSRSSYLDAVMEKVQRLGLGRHVRYLGPKKLEELVHEIQNCDVGVIPNQRNIFTDINTPTRLFEYLSLGKPVIAPGTAGILDYFGPECLFLFESGNAEELAERIEYVAGHPMEAIESAELGQQVYREHTWSREREGLVGHVSSLLGSENASAS